jgi:hypothetical protein
MIIYQSFSSNQVLNLARRLQVIFEMKKGTLIEHKQSIVICEVNIIDFEAHVLL